MEDNSNTSSEKYPKAKSIVYLDNSINHEIFTEISKIPGIETSKVESGSDVSIRENDGNFKISDNITKNVICNNISLKNLSYYLMQLNDTNITNFSNSNEIRVSPNKIQTFLDQLYKALQESINIKDFIKNISNMLFIKKFSKIHLFIHEKGHSHSKHLELIDSHLNSSDQTVSEFTNLFLAIKKSKNRTFGQSTLKGSNFNIIGTCLASTMELQYHNVIFVLSNEDFLHQKEEDILFFNLISPTLNIYFNSILSIQMKKKKDEHVKSIIYSILGIEDSKNLDVHKVDFIYKINTLEASTLNISDSHHKDKISLLGDLLNTLKHELSNPLFGMALTTDLLLLEKLDQDQCELVTGIKSSIERSQKILNSFSDLYTDTNTFQEINLEDLVNEVIVLTKSETRGIKISTVKNSDHTMLINTNSTWLAQILFNLIINASQAMIASDTSNPHIDINLSVNKEVIIYVSDNGPGVPLHIEREIFNPFFTTKNTGNGLGLAISKNLTNKLNGKLTFIRNKNGGSTFRVKIPNEDTNN